MMKPDLWQSNPVTRRSDSLTTSPRYAVRGTPRLTAHCEWQGASEFRNSPMYCARADFYITDIRKTASSQMTLDWGRAMGYALPQTDNDSSSPFAS